MISKIEEIFNNYKLIETIRPIDKPEILQWVNDNIDLSLDKATANKGKIVLYPYQKEIIKDSESGCHTQIIQAPQQCGKSTIYRIILAYRLACRPAPACIVYPNLDLAESTNRDSLLPILTGIEALKPALSRSRAIRGDRIDLGQCVCYIGGAGSPIVSRSIATICLDEADFWPCISDMNLENLRNAEARTTTYEKTGEKLILIVSSPDNDYLTYKQWLKSSQGIYHIKCLECNHYFPTNKIAFPIAGGKWAGLQWAKDDKDNIIENSIRWICPNCLKEHTYADAEKMTQGKFIHNDINNKLVKGYLLGALSNPMIPWIKIAKAKKEEINNKDQVSKSDYYHRYLCMPLPSDKESKQDNYYYKTIKSKIVPLDDKLKSEIVAVFAGIDVQGKETNLEEDNYYVYCVRGYKNNGDSILLDTGKFDNKELISFLNKKYLNLPLAMAFFDSGGFSRTEKDKIIMPASNAVYFKGDTTHGSYKPQAGIYYYYNDKDKMYHIDPYKIGQQNLLFDIYETTDFNKWLIADNSNVNEDYITQMANIQPAKDTAIKDGNDPKNWKQKSDKIRKDIFDAEKMLVCLNHVLYNINSPIAPLKSCYKDGVLPKFFKDKYNQTVSKMLG